MRKVSTIHATIEYRWESDFSAIIAVTEMAASAAAQRPAVSTFVRLMHERYTGFHRVAPRPPSVPQDIPRESSGIANVSLSLVSPLRATKQRHFSPGANMEISYAPAASSYGRMDETRIESCSTRRII